MQNLIVPTDYSFTAKKALDFAVQIARKAQVEIIVVHACEMIDSVFTDHQEQNQAITDKANVQLSLLKKNIEATERLVVNTRLYKGTVRDNIMQAAEEYHAAFIIMGSLGKTGLHEKLFGSKTAQIIGETTVPVIIIPPLYVWKVPEKILLAVNNFEENPDIISPVIKLAALFTASIHIAMSETLLLLLMFWGFLINEARKFMPTLIL